MTMLTETVKSGDWKNEKHVPSLNVEKVEGGFKVHSLVGEEIEHPNTAEHHIAWIKVFFQPEGFSAPVEVASQVFGAHGEGEAFTKPELCATIKSEKGGKFFALSYCNIHGLWENSLEI